ncbi:tetratricopeptide repeat protein [Melittangium boletus]|uniref:MJ0042 family finger-like domain/tetratricopeptide repeat protein n=1 Tax=Melittangium boletus DSM 14713 TaxID=1294270 RepID=A0A250IKN2_9BACT|nr:tetratricopeptide repeat protein [Melittangium boletus]ATB31741.1 MJ0042 family finger-like domain/tetratricopeptide repeat protein [Melittangium boletus DSM 14713]
MKVSCPSCQTNYNIDDKRIPPGGAKLKCARCQNTFPIKPDESASAPAAAAPAAIPLPGPARPQAPAFGGSDDLHRPVEETTRVVSLPLPSAAFRDNAPPPAREAIPLPGATPPADDFDISTSEPESNAHYGMSAPQAPAGEAIPLPGASDPYGYGGDAYAEDPYAAQAPADAVALPPPASSEDPYAYAGDPYAADPYAQAPADAVALPPPASSEDPYAYAGDPYAADPYAQAPADAIALPPPASSEDPYAYAGDPAQDASFAMPPPQPEESFASVQADDAFALPPPAEDTFAAVEEDPFALPPPPAAEAADPFAAVEEDPFALPPPPAAEAADPFAAVEEDPFALPPPPAGAVAGEPMSMDVGLDFSEPPAEGGVTTGTPGFDDVDFGGPSAGASPASIPDALEFDPTAPAMPPGGDDLEVDLSAPLPPPPTTGAADGLEMLSFIDDAAKDNGANKARGQVRRYQVRRRSGKVFGPFEEGVVVKMLEDGQLLGNEDVSSDGEGWVPIGTVAIFAAAIQKLMEGPGTPAVAAAAPAADSKASNPAAANAASAANMERINQLYGGRMAQVSVVDTTSRAEIIMGKVKQRLPLVISVAAGVVVLSVGLGFGATRYGVFGVKKLFPAKVKAGSELAASVDAAHKALLLDSVEGYKQAREHAAKVLADDEYPEVRALWCQATFYLQRRYSVSPGSDVADCRAEEMRERLELLGEQNLEYVKYLAGSALVARDANGALRVLSGAWSRDDNKGDVELALLLAEAQASMKQNAAAIATLDQVIKKEPKLAKAQHALGNLYQEVGKADEAVKAYEAALEADPTHLISTVELAAVELLLRKEAQKGLDAAERALDEKAQAHMGPAELSRARTLKGIALFQLFNLPEAEKELRAALEKEPGSLTVKRYLGQVLQAQRQFEQALPFFEAVAKAEPKNIDATEGFISTLVTLGKVEDAQKQVQEASKRFPDNAHIEYLYGRIDEARDNNSSAEQHYTKALKADPQLIEAHVSLGRLHLRLRHNDQAKTQFEEAAAKAPDKAPVHVGLGELALAEDDIAKAQEEFTRAVGLDPNLADAHLGLSRLALLAGDLTKARQEADKALELDPHSLKGGRLQRGTVMWRQGALDDAIAELERAKKEEPRSVAIPTTLGAVYLDKGSALRQEKKETEANNGFKEAETNLMLALKGEPSNAEANFYLAQVKARRGEFTQAIESMKTAVERASKRADYHYALGLLYRDAKLPADAISEWNKTITLDPKLVDAYEALGQAHLERNEIDEAISAYQSALKADPTRTRALASIGDAHFTAMHWRDAVKSYEQALKADPSLTQVYYKLGRAWSEQSQYGKAIEFYNKALAKTPDNADSWYHLGYAYKEKGKKKDAVKSFREYLSRKPEAQDRKEIEDEIAFLQ